jgi:DNA-binding NarL/FixJ family response regulator
MVDIDGEQLAVLSHPVGGGLAGAKLTKAESEVATAVSEGLSNRDVARLRGTSERTVAKQIAATFRKLGISSRRQLLARTRGGEAE